MGFHPTGKRDDVAAQCLHRLSQWHAELHLEVHIRRVSEALGVSSRGRSGTAFEASDGRCRDVGLPREGRL